MSQIWYVIEGAGDMWLRDADGRESVTPLAPGTALTVPLGTSFQFRSTGARQLSIFIVNTSPWTGAGELIPVPDHWTPHVATLK